MSVDVDKVLLRGHENQFSKWNNDDKVVFALVVIAVVVPIIGSIIFRMMEN